MNITLSSLERERLRLILLSKSRYNSSSNKLEVIHDMLTDSERELLLRHIIATNTAAP